MKRIVLWLMIGLMVVSVLQPIGVKAETLLIVDELFAGESRIVVSNRGYGELTVKAEDETILFSRNVWAGKQTLELNRTLREGELISFYLNGQFVQEHTVSTRLVTIASPMIEELDEDAISITGRGIEGSFVDFYINGQFLRSTYEPIRSERRFYLNLQSGLQVDDRVAVRLRNAKGEVSETVEVTVNAAQESLDLFLNPYYADMGSVIGKVKPLSKLYVKRADGTLIAQLSDTYYSFTIPILERLEEGETLTVTPYSFWGREGKSETLQVRKARTKLPISSALYEGDEHLWLSSDRDTASYSYFEVKDESGVKLGWNTYGEIYLKRQLVKEELTLTFFDYWDGKLGETKVKVLSRNEDENPTVEPPSIDFVKTITNQTRWASLCTNTYVDGIYRIIALNDQGELLDYRYIDNYKCEMHLNKPLSAGTSFTVQIVDGRDGEVYREEVIEVVEATKVSSPIVQKITDRSTYIEGRVTETEWVEDNIITVNDATNRKLCETHVNFDRTFSCQLKELLPAGMTVSVTQTADGYYPSDPTVATVSRTFNEPTPPIVIVPPSEVKPGAPILHPVTSDALGLTGSGTPGLVVKAWNEFGFRLGEATVNTDGSFRIPLERKLPQGIGVRVVQLQGGTMSDGAQTYVQEGESVTLRLMDTLTDASTRLTGHLERMAFTPVRVELRQGKTVLAKDETTFFFRLDFKPQTKPLTIVLIHADGSETTQTIQPLDTTPPTLATVSTLTDRSTRVFGRAEAGSTIVVRHDKKRLTTKTTTAGVYSLNLPKLRIGEVVTVQAMDEAGNTSPILQRTVLGVQAPLTATASSRVVTGKGEPGSLVRVFSNNKMIGKTVKVDAKGTYRVSIPTQPKGKRLLVTQQKTGYVKQTQTVLIQ